MWLYGKIREREFEQKIRKNHQEVTDMLEKNNPDTSGNQLN